MNDKTKFDNNKISIQKAANKNRNKLFISFPADELNMLLGFVDGEDDYYWALIDRKGNTVLASCVGNAGYPLNYLMKPKVYDSVVKCFLGGLSLSLKCYKPSDLINESIGKIVIPTDTIIQKAHRKFKGYKIL